MDHVLKLKQDVEVAIERLQSGRAVPAEFLNLNEIRLDGDPAWVANMIDSRKMHEPDYAIFGHITPSMGTILDVGANWGYSVGSIRAAGSTAAILSFEMLAAHGAALEAVKKKLGSGYDYILVGVGAEKAILDFYIPTVNGLALTALASAQLDAFGPSMVLNVADYVTAYMDASRKLTFKFLKMQARIDRIDNLLQIPGLDVPTERIAAIKIDVEGFEAAALQGAMATIAGSHPLLMVEGGNRNPSVRTFLDARGYLHAEFENGRLRIADSITKTSNGFFVHASRLVDYKEVGIVV
jgi:FkbM family methyltransferase